MLSLDKRFRLTMQFDDNLVLYDDNLLPIWYTGTNGSSADRAVLQQSGNVVLLNAEMQQI